MTYYSIMKIIITFFNYFLINKSLITRRVLKVKFLNLTFKKLNYKLNQG